MRLILEGNRELVIGEKRLLVAHAVPQRVEHLATGVDGLFMEVHSDPANAVSDGPNQIPLEFIEDLLVKLIAIHHASH
jgi:3-deoxy-D-manno-octulosonic acid (KDO) 8-phosphate synthase